VTSFDSQNFLKSLPHTPGVYWMLGADEEVLYVGKARDLQKRVASYFRRTGLTPKTQALMAATRDMQITVTHTEGEALLLENNLIKEHQPRFNIMLRDDKGYPYIYVSTQDTYPRIDFHRGARGKEGRYFGPYPSSSSVRETLSLLQKTFGVRQCRDNVFSQRSRPCLQYQIHRCSGPCVGLISPEAYAEDVRHTIMFLESRNQGLIEELVRDMEAASARRDYESAAVLRDRIAALKRVQEKQYVSGEGGDVDVLAVAMERETACVSVTMIRDGRQLGSRSYFPKGRSADTDEALAAFLSQYYIGKPVPKTLYTNSRVAENQLIQNALAQQSGHSVRVTVPVRGAPRRWVEMAAINAQDALRRHLVSRSSLEARFESLQAALKLEAIPERIECFDISHTGGEATVGSCVVFTQEGPAKSDYRRFNIAGIEPGDDYGAMNQVFTRRYRRLKDGEGKWPDLILIDGGRGQLAAAEKVFEELQVPGIQLLAVAKGPERKPGMEQLFLSGAEGPTILAADSPALHLIQQIRDEAHRFAITGHRQRRAKSRTRSSLETIPGVGAKRRQNLLKHLGGMQEVARAGVADLARVPGISPELARRIYQVFHRED
jgi:excinuclease ABC subunit C